MPAQTVSIIIPVYNRLTFLDQAIQSALAQTHPPVEILVVDDGSAADAAGHMAKWAGKAKYLRRENGGQGAARNTALAQCHGSHVLFLDDDDFLEPGAVESLLAAMDKTPGAAWAAGAYDYVDAGGNAMGRSHVPTAGNGDLLEQLIRGNPIGAPLAVLLKTEAVRGVGGFDEDRRVQTVEDHDLWFRMARHHVPAVTQEIVAHYRKHPQNITGNQTRHLEARLALLAKQRAILGSHYAKRVNLAEAAIHREFGDVCYLSGRHGEAREHWRQAAGGGGLSFINRIVRVAKSYVPAGARGIFRQVQGATER